MAFDWTTLVLEAVNFLILVWLLKRFFYRPVLAVIERRRAETAETVADAEKLRREAEALKDEYQASLAGADEARAAAKAALDEEMAAERERRLAALGTELEGERQRREALAAREKSEQEQAMARRAVELAARFAARLLERLATPELDARLADLALEELEALAPDKLAVLQSALGEPGAVIEVASAHPLDDERRESFGRALGRVAGRAVAPVFREDSALKAGVCVTVGAWVLMANVRDELKFFTGGVDHGE